MRRAFQYLISVLILTVVLFGCESVNSPNSENGIATSDISEAESHTGDIVYVDANNSGGDGTQSNPYSTIQEGVDHASSGETVQVADGTYSGFTVDSDITVAATGNAIVDASQQGQVVITADGATISGFTLEGDYEPWGPNTYPGGGDDFTPEPTDGSVFDNAVIYANADNVTISSVQVNIEGFDTEVIGMVLRGDGILVNNSTLTVPNGYHGGPIVEFTEGSDVTIENNAFAENIGGIVGANQTVVVQGNSFTGNDKTIGFSGPSWGAIPPSASLTVENNSLVAQVGPSNHENGWFYASDDLQSVISNAAGGGTVAMTGNTSISEQIDIDKSITLDGNGNTIFASFTKAGNSNNSAIGIGADDVTVSNLTIDGSNGENLHGINVYESTGVLVSDVSILDNDHTGLVVNGSEVTAHNISTSGHGWHAMNVDLGTGVPGPAELTVTGTSSHGETYPPIPHIYIDDITKDVSVNDVEGQYSVEESGNARAYFLLGNPETKNDCKKGGWEDYGFKNQGQCIRFVNTGKDSR